jgi:hypothetical protein
LDAAGCGVRLTELGFLHSIFGMREWVRRDPGLVWAPATLVIDCLIEAHGWQSPNQPSETPLAAQKRQCAFCRQRVPIRLTLPWGGQGAVFGIPGALSVFSTEEWGKKEDPQRQRATWQCYEIIPVAHEPLPGAIRNNDQFSKGANSDYWWTGPVASPSSLNISSHHSCHVRAAHRLQFAHRGFILPVQCIYGRTGMTGEILRALRYHATVVGAGSNGASHGQAVLRSWKNISPHFWRSGPHLLVA